jgi:cytochrome c oxidase cbb3-type subunit III
MRTPTLLRRSTITVMAAALLGAGVMAAGSRQSPVIYPPSQVKAGEPLFVAYCGFCHGRDAMGGATGPDLTRSQLVADDVKGDKIRPLVHNGRPEKGMPPLSISESEVTSIVAFIHDQRSKAGSLIGGRRKVSEEDLRTGDAKAGEQYFDGPGGCATCHSPTGDLAGVADRLKGLELLQRMLYPGTRGSQPSPAKVTVTLPSGETVSGPLAFQDEFTIALRDAAGWYRSWPAGRVKFTVNNPLDAHAEQVRKYTDADMHNVLAYVQTLHRPGDAKAVTAAKPDATAAPAVTPYTGGGLESSMLLAPPADAWPTYHGDYSGRRHSRLSAITPENVQQLALAWTFCVREKYAVRRCGRCPGTGAASDNDGLC